MKVGINCCHLWFGERSDISKKLTPGYPLLLPLETTSKESPADDGIFRNDETKGLVGIRFCDLIKLVPTVTLGLQLLGTTRKSERQKILN